MCRISQGIVSGESAVSAPYITAERKALPRGGAELVLLPRVPVLTLPSKRHPEDIAGPRNLTGHFWPPRQVTDPTTPRFPNH